MNYLKYIEHDAENLQFFLWARAYQAKFERLPASERNLSPDWTDSQSEVGSTHTHSHLAKISPDTAVALKGTGLGSTLPVTELATSESEKSNPFCSPPKTPPSDAQEGNMSSEINSTAGSGCWSSTERSTANISTHIKRKVDGAFDGAGLKWQPCKWPVCSANDDVIKTIT